MDRNGQSKIIDFKLKQGLIHIFNAYLLFAFYFAWGEFACFICEVDFEQLFL